ncbi:MAG: TnsA-like heteromeric transposase endonuclease subunit [Segniliparus sp.]|uniref:TnsA-like heteromeric transposase endonuclease subunit n=1 Tax=Segniliparus sp. TaxID=2804064 RepID=UPI003F30A83E
MRSNPIPSPKVDLASARVQFRGRDGSAARSSGWMDTSLDLLASSVPWRTFRWYRGQRHYSGAYWSATERRHVIYESRLELARLLFADFDRSVRQIVAQPFLLSAEVDGVQCKHIPDYLLITDQCPVVVDVKPRSRWLDPTVAHALAWTKRAIEGRGWRYEVAGEPSEAELANVRFLAGYRRDWLFDKDLLDELRSQDLAGAALEDAFHCLPNRPVATTRSGVLHLLWRQELICDIAQPLSRSLPLRIPA